MAILVGKLPRWVELHNILLLVVSIVIGAILYLMMNVLTGGLAFREAVVLIRGKAS